MPLIPIHSIPLFPWFLSFGSFPLIDSLCFIPYDSFPLILFLWFCFFDSIFSGFIPVVPLLCFIPLNFIPLVPILLFLSFNPCPQIPIIHVPCNHSPQSPPLMSMQLFPMIEFPAHRWLHRLVLLHIDGFIDWFCCRSIASDKEFAADRGDRE